jgi:GxxExxY protein
MQGLLFEELTYKIRGAVFQVYNTLGFGHKEIVYQKALAHEFVKQKINFEKEKKLDVIYDNEKVGFYRPDFVVDNKIIIELKSLEFMPQTFEKQLIYYLKGTGYRLGLLINFGANKLVIKRKIWNQDQ